MAEPRRLHGNLPKQLLQVCILSLCNGLITACIANEKTYRARQLTPGHPPPSCSACKEPVPPPHGYLDWRDGPGGSTLHIRCDEGYVLVGPTVLSCVLFAEGACIWDPPNHSYCQENGAGGTDSKQERSGMMLHTAHDLPGRCALERKVGDCRAAFPRFYFDRTAGQCRQFLYGGCHGNGNNFHTMDNCRAVCGGK